MILLSDVRDWMKSFGIGNNFYVGKLDNKQEKSIGIYSRKETAVPHMAIGGTKNSSYDVKRISVLVHWNKNAVETERAALSLFEKLGVQTDFEIGQTQVKYLRPMMSEPQDVGTDDSGVYERVIWFDLFYERKGEKI